MSFNVPIGKLIFTIAQIIFGILLLIYVQYCIHNRGMHHKGKGWKGIEVAPKSFYFTILLYIIISIGMISTAIWEVYRLV
jgi:hypothetical protein